MPFGGPWPPIPLNPPLVGSIDWFLTVPVSVVKGGGYSQYVSAIFGVKISKSYHLFSYSTICINTSVTSTAKFSV